MLFGASNTILLEFKNHELLLYDRTRRKIMKKKTYCDIKSYLFGSVLWISRILLQLILETEWRTIQNAWTFYEI